MVLNKGVPACIKHLVVIFNILFLICGIGIVGMGVWSLVSPEPLASFMGSGLVEPAAFCMLGVGGIIVILAFCGCAGAALENRCLLIIFFTLMCGIFFALLVFGILVAVFRKDIRTIAKERLEDSLTSHYGRHMAWTDLFNQVQEKLHCCAVSNDGANIYQSSNWYKGLPSQEKKNVPLSCCLRKSDATTYINDKECQTSRPDPGSGNQYMYSQGCLEASIEFVEKYAVIFTIIGSCVVLLIIFGMIFTLALLRSIVQYQPAPYYETMMAMS